MGVVMLSADSIRAHIAALVNGQLSLDDFEDWIISSSWNVLQGADPEVRQLVAAIELRLAEHSSEHLDEADLLSELQALLLYGCPLQPIQSVFMSIGNPSDLTTMTVADRPDFQFPAMSRQPLTSPTTRTASAKTIVRERVRSVS